ncbi:hypothetical protein [Thioalbus denitrificans]|uniref:hypothetical protein n=1 Tax=Thioalbus denitrificans TaxID=547122 RepID=UPI0011C05EA2|nr:hypothetical protein [Thioalbus denitrificans]
MPMKKWVIKFQALVILMGMVGCSISTNYPEPVADGSIIFVRVKLPSDMGYQYGYVRVLEQTMDPERLDAEWGYWQSSDQQVAKADVVKGSGSYIPSQLIDINLASLHWSGNKTGYGWFGTSPLVDGEVQEYATYVCVVGPQSNISMSEALKSCEFKARW